MLQQYPFLMHGADWLPTLAEAAGLDTRGTLPLDGVSQWAAMQNVATTGRLGAATPPRKHVTLGNSTNSCSWPKGDPRRTRYEVGGELSELAGTVDCGFAIRADDTTAEGGHKWKLIRGYGGGPDTWCNSSHNGAVCDNHLVPAAANLPLPTTPTPGVSKCPGGICLYDIGADPHERTELSAMHADVVSELNTRMDAVLASYTHYEEDTSCGPPKFANDSHVGRAWQPWC